MYSCFPRGVCLEKQRTRKEEEGEELVNLHFAVSPQHHKEAKTFFSEV